MASGPGSRSRSSQTDPTGSASAASTSGAPPQAAAPAEAPVTPVQRDLGKALGSRVVESNVAFQGPEDLPDPWEGERFDALGKVLENYFVPGLIVLGIVCGGVAARSYNEGATAFVKPPAGPDAEPSIIIALPDSGVSAPSPSS